MAAIWIREMDSKVFDDKLAALSSRTIVGEPQFWREDTEEGPAFNYMAHLEE